MATARKTAASTDEKLEKVYQQIEELHQRAEALKLVAKTKGIEVVKMLIAKLGLTAEDLQLTVEVPTSSDKRAQAKAPAKKSTARKGPQPAKYRNPATGSTWSGMGRAPSWITESKNGRESFLIANQGEADAAPAKKGPSSKAVKDGAATKGAGAKATKKAAAKSALGAAKVPGKRAVSAKKTAAVKKVAAKKGAERTGAAATSPTAEPAAT